MVYAGTCRRLTAAEIAEKSRNRAPALRLITPEERWGFTDGHMGRYEENLAADCGDFLLRRSDGMFAYQLAVVVDDAAMGVTEVVRGADLLDSTPRQLYLYHLLGLTPPVFYHFPLLLTAEGRRLSKRDGAVGLDSLQDRLPPEEILGRLAFLARFNPSAAPKTAAELLADFDVGEGTASGYPDPGMDFSVKVFSNGLFWRRCRDRIIHRTIGTAQCAGKEHYAGHCCGRG